MQGMCKKKNKNAQKLPILRLKSGEGHFFFLLIIHNQFSTISCRMTSFFDVSSKFSIFFSNFLSKLCPNLYFAQKIGKDLSNSHRLNPILVRSLNESLFQRKALTDYPPPVPKLSAPG